MKFSKLFASYAKDEKDVDDRDDIIMILDEYI